MRFRRPNSSKTFVFYDDFGSLWLAVASGAPRLLKSRNLRLAKTLVETVPKQATFGSKPPKPLGGPHKRPEKSKTAYFHVFLASRQQAFDKINVFLRNFRFSDAENIVFSRVFGVLGCRRKPWRAEIVVKKEGFRRIWTSKMQVYR